jgi:hypothetical protein
MKNVLTNMQKTLRDAHTLTGEKEVSAIPPESSITKMQDSGYPFIIN